MIKLRNICIIAHVDHGKTTLVDHMLRQADIFQAHEAKVERVMDSMDLERERGITIAAKNASITLGDIKVNLVDTPGHSDFGGEVERILGMVDGAILLVDAAEGPLPQTRFVLQKAIKKKLKFILLINKVDRPELRESDRIQEVVNQTFDLFVELNASEEQLEFPILYATAKDGWATEDEEEAENIVTGKAEPGTLRPLFTRVLEHLPAPSVDPEGPLKMMVTNLSYSDYVGRLLIGRIQSGSITKGQRVHRWAKDGQCKSFIASRLATFSGVVEKEIEKASAGEIVILSGTEEAEIGDSIVSAPSVEALPRIKVDEPTLAMVFTLNTSPLSGQEGEAIQGRKLRERLVRETRLNVALRFEETESNDQFRLLGRGELQFAIVIEKLRREGYEFMVGKPLVLYRKTAEGTEEPIEKITLDLPEDHGGDATSLFQQRKGMMTRYESVGRNRVQIEFEIPTRGTLGVRSRYLTLTRGNGLMSSESMGFGPYRGQLLHRSQGALVADRTGKAVEYALFNLEERGVLFVDPGDPVYEGMIVGQSKIENDLNVNPTKEKKLTNMRSAHTDVLVTLKGRKRMSLEQCIEWIDEDEWIEVTPESIRLRKKNLNKNTRHVKRADRIGQ